MSIVFFDKDGVLVDTEQEYLKRNIAFLATQGYHVTAEQAKQLPGGNPKRDLYLYHQWFGDFDDFDFLSKKREYFEKIGLVDFNSLKMPNLDIVLNELVKRKHHITLVSSSSKENIHYLLNLFKIENLFENIVSGEDFEESKPNPEIYRYAKNLYKNTNENIFVVEDSTLGIIAAKEADLTVIALNSKSFAFDQTRADYVISDLVELLDIIK